MRTKTIDTDEELAIIEAVENDEYVSLLRDEFENLKESLNIATTKMTNLNNDTDTEPQ